MGYTAPFIQYPVAVGVAQLYPVGSGKPSCFAPDLRWMLMSKRPGPVGDRKLNMKSEVD